ncbi:MAG TPA: glycosyltransferase family A protein [Candidatus Elarobacter sp.]|nr:glycosyltransferase family A protein [Candidatus Elarobacter sp.]
MTRVAATFLALPPPRPRCVASIALPARDESGPIVRAIEAIVAQRRLDGLSLDPDAYELLVLVNGGADDTAEVAARCAARAPRHAIHVVRAGAHAPESRSVGAARRAVMDAAASRMLTRATIEGAVLTTDADSFVAPDWVAQNLAALRTADAVGGRIVPDPVERTALPACLRAELDAKTVYEFALASLESALDPLPHDPWPRHWQRCGPSLAVRANSYVRAGGLPPLDRLEDFALYRALLAIDARFRHSVRVRVTTSLRLAPRAAGGFGSELAAMSALAGAGRTTLVEHPRTTHESIAARAALRRWWDERDPLDLDDALTGFAVTAAAFRERVASAASFGAALAAVETLALERGVAQRRPQIAIGAASRALARYSSEARANASRPTREMARSGAG